MARSVKATKIVTDDLEESAQQLSVAAEFLDKAGHLLERATYTSRGMDHDEDAARLTQMETSVTEWARKARDSAGRIREMASGLRQPTSTTAGSTSS
jgi:hypothetical protein